MARVNVEQSALTDPRYAILGRAIGRDRWSALGRMTAVWNICQERNIYVLDVDTLNHLFDDIDGFAEAVVKSGLGQKHRHGVYISGSKGRIEWLATKRLNGSKGGRPKRNIEANQAETNRKPIGSPLANPPAPAPAPAPAEEEEALRPKPGPSDTRTIFADDSQELRAAKYLFAKIRTNNPRAKEPNLQTWAKEFDRLFRIDQRERDEVRSVIDLAMAHPFWWKNILSPAKLRAQYDRLLAEKLEGPAAAATATKPRTFVRAPEQPE